MTEPQTLVLEHLARDRDWGLLGTQGHILGIDLGGYGLRAALIDLHGRTYASTYKDMDGNDPPHVLREVEALVQHLLTDQGIAPDRLVRIGVGFGGPVDLHHGRTRLSPRMQGWENFSLKDHVERAFDTVTLVDNDANLIALGEATFGIGQGCQNLFYMHISGGVGGGIVIDGRLYHGATTTAGEIGHAVVGPGIQEGDRLYNLEELVSVKGLLRRANALGLDTGDIAALFSDATIGRQVLDEAINLLALRIAQIVSLLDPQMVVLGGRVVRTGGDPFIQAIAARMEHYISPQFAQPVQVVGSVLGNDSITIGALALALQSLRD